jgi:hypothetical protein
VFSPEAGDRSDEGTIATVHASSPAVAHFERNRLVVRGASASAGDTRSQSTEEHTGLASLRSRA